MNNQINNLKKCTLKRCLNKNDICSKNYKSHCYKQKKEYLKSRINKKKILDLRKCTLNQCMDKTHPCSLMENAQPYCNRLRNNITYQSYPKDTLDLRKCTLNQCMDKTHPCSLMENAQPYCNRLQNNIRTKKCNLDKCLNNSDLCGKEYGIEFCDNLRKKEIINQLIKLTIRYQKTKKQFLNCHYKITTKESRNDLNNQIERNKIAKDLKNITNIIKSF